VITIPTYDPHLKLLFLLKDAIRSFSCHMSNHFATTTILFVITEVRSEIDNKFELLVVNGSNPKDIQIVSF
jgi:hypothetical protein